MNIIVIYATREFKVKSVCALKTRGRVILCVEVFYIKFPCYIKKFSSHVGVNANLRNLPWAYNCGKRPQ